MAKTSPASKADRDPIPDSLIEMHCARADWEDSVLEEIRAAHAARDVDQVMSLLSTFFTEGPGTLKEEDDEANS
jgi:hypothetical protein